ncbi:MAG: ATP-dependent helicase [Candidatus Schekmanbacteria bacterium]|nr:ATP-dependent helicase [Candidatus Schekmanbacteria bacterium]
MEKYILVKHTNEEIHLNKPIDYKEDLNSTQYEAVMHRNGPMLVIAGAGSGKTRTLIYRVARLINDNIFPESILLLTFTKKAAQEMLRRSSILIDNRCEKVSGGTFHSFANSLLRKYVHLIGMNNNFTILDRGDNEDVIGIIRNKLGLSDKEKRFPKKNTIQNIISLSVNQCISINEAIKKDCPHFEEWTDEIVKLKDNYISYKKENNLVDYDDLLILTNHILEQKEDVRHKLSQFYQYIMVDEYQDTNRIQAQMVRLLAYTHDNVVAVGDDSQSIYSFRGATFRNIMDFPKEFPGTKLITLEENYRSTQSVLDLTNKIISSAKEKYPKKLFSSKNTGNAPALIKAPDEFYQSRFVVQKIMELNEEGVDLRDIAVLFRFGHLSYDLEIELNRRNIPYVKYGGFKFIETSHIKDILSFIRVMINRNDIISWSRMLQLIDGLGEKTAMLLAEVMKNTSIITDKDKILSYANKRNKEGIKKLLDLLFKLNDKTLSVAEQIRFIIEYYLPILKEKYDDYPKRVKDIDHFIAISERFKNMETLASDMVLEPPSERKSISDVTAEDKYDDLLVLSTIHSAKGLEWHTVFIIWTLEGIFPSSYSLWREDELEEERRLMYVAATRAKENLFISYPVNIYERGSGILLTKPSQFLTGIPGSLLEHWALVDDD